MTRIGKAIILLLTFFATQVVAARGRRTTSPDQRYLQGIDDGIISEVPIVDFALDVNDKSGKSSNNNCSICETGCEGNFSAIHEMLDDLWDQQEQEYELFFTVQGRYAVAAGVIYNNFPKRVQALRDNHPEVDTIILVECPGSANDDASLAGSKLVHSYGYTTCVPSDGHTASGGTDFFVSGFNRYASPGARIGIHSWAGCTDETCNNVFVGSDFPRDHEDHKPYLSFYDNVCIPKDFYWETLSHGLPMYYIQEEELQGTFSYMRDCDGQCDLEKDFESNPDTSATLVPQIEGSEAPVVETSASKDYSLSCRVLATSFLGVWLVMMEF